MEPRTRVTSSRHERIKRRLRGAALLLCLPLLLTTSRPPTALETVLNSGELHIISRNGPTTYYEGSQGLDGFEYHLAKIFADHLGVKLIIEDKDTLKEIFNALAKPSATLAAADLTVTDERKQNIRFTVPYQDVTQKLLYRNGEKRPKTIEDLYGKRILVVANSSHSERLKELQKDHPQLIWHEQGNVEMIELVEMVHDGTIDHTIVDSNAFDLNRGLFPRARVAFDTSEAQQLAWALPKNSDDSLYNVANEFLIEARDSNLLNELTERFYGHVDSIDANGALTFGYRLKSRLPKWKETLKKAGEKHDLDWHLLAAISYQESHWNPKATSYTGVRGMMMLTNATAKEVGVTDRLDPVQSIDGGAIYFKKIYNRLPKTITGNDRTWMTLASYNVGYGHLEDARVLTQRLDKDPNKWSDVREHLPLLTKRKYYSKARYGYARGWEPVYYVQNIRSFYKTIAWQDQLQQRHLATIQKEKDTEIAPNTQYDTDNIKAMSVL